MDEIANETWNEQTGEFWTNCDGKSLVTAGVFPYQAPPTTLHARRGWVGGAGASLGPVTEYIAELLTLFIQMDGQVAALYLHDN